MPWEHCTKVERRETHSRSEMSDGLQAPRLPILDRGVGPGEMSSRLPPALVLRFRFLIEGHGAAQLWEAPENLPKKSLIEVLPEAKGNCPTYLLEGIFEFWDFPDFPKHLADSQTPDARLRSVVLRLGFDLARC